VIFLLNRERVLLEVVELARLKIAALLKLPGPAVSARIELKAGRLSPVFEVASDMARGLSEVDVREAIASVREGTRAELTTRLEGLQITRQQMGASS
jgi:hypothetical protein